jgi:hypothetical protein
VNVVTENVPVSTPEQLVAEYVPDKVDPLRLPLIEKPQAPTKTDFTDPENVEPVTVPLREPPLSIAGFENVSANCPLILLPDCVIDSPTDPEPATLSSRDPE